MKLTVTVLPNNKFIVDGGLFLVGDGASLFNVYGDVNHLTIENAKLVQSCPEWWNILGWFHFIKMIKASIPSNGFYPQTRTSSIELKDVLENVPYDILGNIKKEE